MVRNVQHEWKPVICLSNHNTGEIMLLQTSVQRKQHLASLTFKNASLLHTQASKYGKTLQYIYLTICESMYCTKTLLYMTQSSYRTRVSGQ